MNNLKIYRLLFPGVLYCLSAHAIDDQDTAYYNRLLAHGHSLHYSNPDSAIFYYGLIMGDSAKVTAYSKDNLNRLEKAFLVTVIRAQNYAGNIYYYDDEFFRAEACYQRSLDMACKAGFKEYTATSLYDVGYIRYVTSKYVQAAEMFSESYDLFSGSGNYQGMFDAIQGCGLSHRHLGNLELADSCYRKSFELARIIGDSLQVADVQLNYGILLCEQGNLDEGTKNFEEALRFYESHGEDDAVSLALLNIGVVMKMIGEFGKARTYIEWSTKMEEVSGYKSQLVIRYYNLADLYLETGQLTTAYDYCMKTLGVANEIGTRPFVSECNLLLGKYYYLAGDYKAAGAYFQAAADSVQNSNDKPLKANILLWYSRSLIKSGNLDSAIKLAEDAVSLSEELQLPVNRKEAAQVLSEAFEKAGNLSEALAWYKKFQVYSDSLNFTNQHKEISRIEARYNFDKKEQENELLRNQASLQEQKLRTRNVVTIGLVTGIILSLVIILLLVRRSQDVRLLFRQQQLINLKHLEELEQELDGKNRELTSKMMFLNQKNDMITRLIARLQDIRDNTEHSTEEIVTLVNELRSDAPQGSWKEFETQFIQVHPGFYQRLFERHPELTSNEQRLCAFLRMNLNTKEIASITGRSPKSIEVTRSRIRQKLALGRNLSLSSYLSAI